MARLKGAKRQKNQLELAFGEGITGEARSLSSEGTEASVAKINPQHALSLRLILYWKQALPSGSSCVGQDSLLMPVKNRTIVKVSSRRRCRLSTTALLGLAPVRSARASAANHRENISACQHDDLGVANRNVTSK